MIAQADIIATRALTVFGEDGSPIAAEARIGRPRREDEEPGEETWVCEIEVIGPNGPLIAIAADDPRRGPLRETSICHGTDSVNALENAIIALGIALDGLGDRVAYLDVRGYHGLRKMIYAYSPSIEKHLGTLVDDERTRITSELQEPGGADRVRARFPAVGDTGRD